MQLSPTVFLTKWNTRFEDNDDFVISEADLREFTADIKDSFTSFATGPNNRPDLSKSVRYYRRADLLADTFGGDCFEDLIEHSPALLCALATVFKVEFYRLTDGDDYEMNVELVAIYDPESTVLVSRTGAFGGDVVPARFVPRNSPEAKYGYLRRYALKPNGTPVVTDWRLGERCIFALNGEDAFFFAKRPGLLAAPGATETADWRPAPAPPAQGTGYTRAEADALLARKADLDATGKVPLSQMPTQYRFVYDYEAGQTQAPEYKILSFGAAGYYGLERVDNATVQATYLNDVLIAFDAFGRVLLAQGDRLRIEATAPAGHVGYIILSQIL